MHEYEALLAENARPAGDKPWVPLLIVEDDRSLLPIFDWIIRQENPQLAYHWCTSLSQARESLRNHHYGLILSDFLLEEGSNGLELFELNSGSRDPSKFVLMSGLELARICRFEGAHRPRMLAKPLEIEEVRELIREAARTHPA